MVTRRVLGERLGRRVLALAVVMIMGAIAPPAIAREFLPAQSLPWRQSQDLQTIAEAKLPRSARRVLQMIRDDAPFPYEKDGAVFGNREGLLPRQPRGYYREYTVPTPWARDRGARRIVCGGTRRQAQACYYTDDHYSSFKRIQG